MHCKEAVFLSSLNSATLTISGYGVQITTDTEEYKPAFVLYPGPYHRDVYTLIVARKIRTGKWAEPHVKQVFYDIDALVETLEAWKIEVEGWEPDEVEKGEEE